MATRYVDESSRKGNLWGTSWSYTPALPVSGSGNGWGVLLGPGGNPSAGRQDRDLQRFNRKRAANNTQESLSKSHGLSKISKYGS